MELIECRVTIVSHDDGALCTVKRLRREELQKGLASPELEVACVTDRGLGADG